MKKKYFDHVWNKWKVYHLKKITNGSWLGRFAIVLSSLNRTLALKAETSGRTIWKCINKTEKDFRFFRKTDLPISHYSPGMVLNFENNIEQTHLHIISIKTSSLPPPPIRSQNILQEQIGWVSNPFQIAEENMFYLTRVWLADCWEYLLYTYVFIWFVKQALFVHSQRNHSQRACRQSKYFQIPKAKEN